MVSAIENCINRAADLLVHGADLVVQLVEAHEELFLFGLFGGAGEQLEQLLFLLLQGFEHEGLDGDEEVGEAASGVLHGLVGERDAGLLDGQSEEDVEREVAGFRQLHRADLGCDVDAPSVLGVELTETVHQMAEDGLCG